MSYNMKSKFFDKFEDIEDCVKIPNSCKKTIKQFNYKKLSLKKRDSVHSHKNMRRNNNDWKNFNQEFNNVIN